MTKLRRFLALSLIISIAGAGLPAPAQAGMLATENALAAQSGARERLNTRRHRHARRAPLEAYGVNPADV